MNTGSSIAPQWKSGASVGHPRTWRQVFVRSLVSSRVEFLRGDAKDAKIDFVRKDEDPRDYRVSFAKSKTNWAAKSSGQLKRTSKR